MASTDQLGLLKQQTLHIGLRDDATFATYYPGDNNEACEAIAGFAKADATCNFLYVWGSAGVGKTHLLQALVQALPTARRAMIVSMHEIMQTSVEVLQGLEQLDVIAVDDIDAICGNAQWEEAFFHFYNRFLTSNAKLMITAKASVRELQLTLPDLRSRLSQAVVYHLDALADEDKVSALQLHAHHRGMNLEESVAQYLIKRCGRDMKSLISVLDKLDVSSLEHKRKLTIPFVKEILAL